MSAGTRRFGLGDFEVTTLLDGVVVRDDGHAVFGANRDPAEVEALAARHGLDVRALADNFVPVLVRTPTALVLFDTGFGAAMRPQAGQLTARLAEVGVAPGDIDVVVLTHLHGDHVGGLTEDGAPAFANARHVTGAREFRHWTEAQTAPAVETHVRPLADRFTLIEDGAEIVRGITAEAAFGHTPGHMIHRLESAGQRLTLTADTANHPVLALLHPDWHFAMDVDPLTAAATRRRVCADLAARGEPCVGHHMPFPALGRIEAAGDGFRWLPLEAL
mgnify:FL=1